MGCKSFFQPHVQLLFSDEARPLFRPKVLEFDGGKARDTGILETLWGNSLPHHLFLYFLGWCCGGIREAFLNTSGMGAQPWMHRCMGEKKANKRAGAHTCSLLHWSKTDAAIQSVT